MPRGRPKKIISDVETTGAGVSLPEPTVSKKVVLETLLKARTPGIFDREPAPAFNGNLNKLVDDIINIFN